MNRKWVCENSRGAALPEYVVLIGILLVTILIALPKVGRGAACNFCAAQQGLETASTSTWELVDTAYAAFAPPEPPPPPPTYMQLCKDGFIDLNTCTAP